MTLPIRTLFLCGAAVIVFWVPALQKLFIYDRVLIADGEWWRVITGHLVHHSPTHLAYDAIAFAIGGTLIEQQRHRHLVFLCLTAALAIGVILYIAMPEMRYYGGLSGIVTAVLVYQCLWGLAESSPWNWLYLVALLGIGAKSVLEFVWQTPLTTHIGAQAFVPIPLSHASGAAVALVFFMCTRYGGLDRDRTIEKLFGARLSLERQR